MVAVPRKVVLALLAPAVVAAAAVVDRLSRRGLERVPTVATEEFPGIDRDLLEKFSSFDPELGWCPQRNRTKQKDTGDHLPGEELKDVVTYSTDEYGSRVSNQERDPDADVTVSTYGDSYCFCREVDDDETFQHYLSEELGSHVGNYGAGNYGLDQALMRLERNYENDPTDHVMMVVTAASVGRILSVWKHYQEFGNILAVKPRFVLDGGELGYLDSPVDEKEDLLDLESRADYLRAHDYHHEHWFQPHHATFPYATDLLADPDNVRYAAYDLLADVEEEHGLSVPGLDPGARRTELGMAMEEPRAAYHDELFDEKRDLFEAIIGRFVEFADEHDFTPTFVMVGQLRYAKYEQEHGPVYGDLMDELDRQFDDLVTVDMARHFDHVDDVESLYVRRGEGGHYSPESNEQIARVLKEQVLERTVEAPQ